MRVVKKELPLRIVDMRRFFSKIKVRRATECWEFQGVPSHIRPRFALDGSSVMATRYAYLAFHLRHPGELYVLHKCDNPRCCNPSHLFLGTQAENVRDMYKKGRQNRPSGEDSGKVKDSDETCLRAMYEYRTTNKPQGEVAEKFGINYSTFSLIVRGGSRPYLQQMYRERYES